jgi:hypothetical protein
MPHDTCDLIAGAQLVAWRLALSVPPQVAERLATVPTETSAQGPEKKMRLAGGAELSLHTLA